MSNLTTLSNETLNQNEVQLNVLEKTSLEGRALFTKIPTILLFSFFVAFGISVTLQILLESKKQDVFIKTATSAITGGIKQLLNPNQNESDKNESNNIQEIQTEGQTEEKTEEKTEEDLEQVETNKDSQTKNYEYFTIAKELMSETSKFFTFISWIGVFFSMFFIVISGLCNNMQSNIQTNSSTLQVLNDLLSTRKQTFMNPEDAYEKLSVSSSFMALWSKIILKVIATNILNNLNLKGTDFYLWMLRYFLHNDLFLSIILQNNKYLSCLPFFQFSFQSDGTISDLCIGGNVLSVQNLGMMPNGFTSYGSGKYGKNAIYNHISNKSYQIMVASNLDKHIVAFAIDNYFIFSTFKTNSNGITQIYDYIKLENGNIQAIDFQKLKITNGSNAISLTDGTTSSVDVQTNIISNTLIIKTSNFNFIINTRQLSIAFN